MKIKLKTLSDKITAVVLYLICMTIVITMFLEVSYMADYGFYDKVGTTQDTFYTLMEEKVDKEYSDIEKFVLITFEKEAENKLKESNIDNSTAANYTENPLYSNKRAESEKDTITYKTLCDKYQNHNKTNLIIVATSNNKMYTLGEPAASLNEETCFETTRTTSFYDVTIKGMRPVTIQIKIKKDLSADDTFRLTARLIKTANNLKYFIVVVMFIALVTGMAIVAVLIGQHQLHSRSYAVHRQNSVRFILNSDRRNERICNFHDRANVRRQNQRGRYRSVECSVCDSCFCCVLHNAHLFSLSCRQN